MGAPGTLATLVALKETSDAALGHLALNLACFFQELVRLDFTRQEALELTREYQRAFLDFTKGSDTDTDDDDPSHAGHAGGKEAP